MKLKFLIADDHSIFRFAVRQILSAAFPGAEFGEARTTQESISIALADDWSVMILDMIMPGRGGIDVLHEIQKHCPKIPVIVMSGQSEDDFAVRAIRAGAAGYLTKDSAPDELAKAVQQVLDGHRYFTPSVAEKLAVALYTGVGSRPQDLLSDREFHVLRLLASGKSPKEIGAELSVSVKTVSTYRTRMLEKLNLHTTAELIRYAVNHKIVG